MKVIIYKQDNGRVAIIYPQQWAVDEHGIQAVALKDVPAGKPFKIVEDTEIPQDRSQRDSWTVDDEELTDGVGADWEEFQP